MVTVEQAIGPLPSPVAVAARLRVAGVQGLVFLDSAGNAYHPTPLSMIAANPEAMISGSLRSDSDVVRLRAAIEGMQSAKPSGDLGLPMGGLFGGVDFDGTFCFGKYSKLLVFDHARKRWFDIGGFLKEHSTALDFAEDKPTLSPSLHFTPVSERSWYEDSVRRAQEYIAAGDIYQVNIAHAFESAWPADADAFPFYQVLRRHSPAPYSAFLDIEGRQVMSASPESFLKISGNCIRTCPIKGTRPRFRDEERDEKSAYDLLTSPKEVSELIMITDLERNDLGQICDFGTVRVSELLKIERFEQVFHLVSTVNGQLRPDVDHVTALRACFPGGSITGAPKKRATEIIAELEQLPRGLYTGAIGYLGANGESQFNIAIRTAIAEGDHVSFHVGAGIVADSDPAFEYEETLHKAAGILQAAKSIRSIASTRQDR
ncbi:MAG: anthranilate synthase component I family protein [Verrucomicrobiae bacterium]|nr:anthranilate synthase component I family protein [Verrucomicrobiae bacterium]